MIKFFLCFMVVFQSVSIFAQIHLDAITVANINSHIPDLRHNFIKIHEKLCSLKTLENFENENFLNLGLPLKRVKKNPLNLEDLYQSRMTLELNHNASGVNKIVIIPKISENKLSYIYSLYFLRENSLSSTVNQNPLVFKAFTFKDLDRENCFFMGATRFFNPGERKDGMLYLELDSEGRLYRTHFSNVAPLTLFEIYGSDPHKLNQIQSLEAKNKRIKVGIIDSGIDYNHPELAYKIERRHSIQEERELLIRAQESLDKDKEDKLRNFLIRGIDLRDQDSSPYDFDGLKKMGPYFPYVDFHGTEVAYVLTKETEEIMIVPGKYDEISLPSIPLIMQEQISQGVRVINMSFNYSGLFKFFALDSGIRKIIKDNSDVLFVVAAGNDGREKTTYPGSLNFPNVINVGASDSKDELWEQSTYGKTVFILAPGMHQTILPGNKNLTQFSSGTSFSAPVVSRLAARMLYRNNSLKPWEIKKILCDSSDKKSSLEDKVICPGIVNEQRALLKALP